MKLSLRWIFDHIEASWKDIPLEELVPVFNKKTAEIESVERIELFLDSLFLARVTQSTATEITLVIPENRVTLTLPVRLNSIKDDFFLIYKDKNGYRWASITDFGGSKDGLLPAITVAEEKIYGMWRKEIEAEDYILTVDNKSVTHRPDMWGHRGFAREIAALFNLKLKPEELFLATMPIKQYEKKACDGSLSVNLLAEGACDRFATVSLTSVASPASALSMASRLVRIDSRPIHFLVDATNYVMFDVGQPLHAFDAQKIKTKKLEICYAQEKQKLELLDGETIELSSDDLVITDGERPIALAGVMGGGSTSITRESTHVYVEAAHYKPSVIRAQAVRCKKRTEASARFEKNIDPNQNTQGLLRFLHILDVYGINYAVTPALMSLGKLAEPLTITLSHDFIIRHLGITVSAEMVEKIMVSLGFGVVTKQHEKQIDYSLTVPTFRSTKDVRIAEDVVEEIGRMIGYEKIPLRLPTRLAQSQDLSSIMRKRSIKQQLAFTLALHEVKNYAFYDEQFLEKIGYSPSHALMLKNPVSQNEKKLVTSLIPHMLKNITQNIPQYDSVRLFECNAVWKRPTQSIQEQQAIAGIIYSRRERVDFYESKALLETFFAAHALSVSWQKTAERVIDPWYSTSETADLWVNNQRIGTAGKASPHFLSMIADGDAFIFELSGDFLYTYQPEQKRFSPLQKYQESHLDISLLIDRSLTTQSIQSALLTADKRIHAVQLIDFYEQKDWITQRSITLRCTIFDSEKTLTSQEIEAVYAHIKIIVEQLGATIR